jgi:ribulose-phosphate 3-epimerase
MSRSVRIAPSILSADFARLGDEVQAAEAAGADIIHVDVMDGQFVPNITVGPLVVSAVRRITDLHIDVHLMIERPERYLPAFVEAGANSISVHPESTPHLHRALQQIRDLGSEAGAVLNPATPEIVLKYVLPYLDFVLVMTVNPGFGGQELIPATIDKVQAIRRMLDDGGRASAWLSVDGGIDRRTAPEVVAHGADTLVAGSAVFGAPEGVAAAVQALRDAVSRV